MEKVQVAFLRKKHSSIFSVSMFDGHQKKKKNWGPLHVQYYLAKPQNTPEKRFVFCFFLVDWGLNSELSTVQSRHSTT
jgi:hypothetical protein